ncbi:Protein GrpE [Rickettsiales endosymbiont of Paramecium tredecaurelia]|uniref:nucleotide exchange factor GrpE n=1 Tax=Candidatus Sarmatiella mevalonica TaxID=2770581 RepID=UPI001921C837|nr:nucleotide exchange factor GrpE [Candidatus Sarmatiella mevalonica]MBL3285080.1 Protein GrpE [Candidatus Sarmatiella mevalonica]
MIDKEDIELNINSNQEEAENIDQDYEDAEQYIDETKFLKEQIAELNHKLLSVVAECDNMSKRHERILEDTKDYAVTNLIKELVVVMDNLDRALEHSKNTEDLEVKNMALGIQMTKDALQSIFLKHGVVIIDPKAGDKFDYRAHHAIKSEDAGQEDGSIIQTVQVGYSIKNRLVRSAMVIVQGSSN